MEAGLLVLLVVVVVVALVVVAVRLTGQKRRSAQLHDQFGDEYDRTVEQRGDRREAEAELAGRAQRRSKLDIRPLDEDARERYALAWRRTQADFVDEPQEAVREADVLVTEVMRERGYPMDDFEQRSADISVDHPELVEDYRHAHRVAMSDRDGGRATTEELREAMVRYRALFDRLLEGARS